MASSSEFLTFVCEQIRGVGNIRYRKMFGDYMIYLNDKPVLLVCDDTPYVKICEETTALMEDASTGYPYDGAKLHYVLDVENEELSRLVLTSLERITPLPNKRKDNA